MSDPTPHDPTTADAAPPEHVDADPTSRSEIRHPQVTVQLVGRDGNAFAIIGRIAAALRQHVGPDAETRFTAEAFACTSYEQLLALAMRTVDVT
jgi:hypothetical protein